MQHLRLALAVLLLSALAAPGVAWAHASGIGAEGCEGCHSGGKVPTVTLTASPENPAVGAEVTLTVTVSQSNGPTAGFFLTTEPQVGTFKAIQAGTALNSGGVIHTMPHTGSDGFTTFQAAWSTTQPTGAQFYAYAISANGDGTSGGDGAGQAILGITSGCTGNDYYLDQDGDGFGTSDPGYPVLRDCSAPLGYSAVSGDCNDFDATIHPGATEVCNGKDDNCNGMIDEGLSSHVYCRDIDGDGHGVPSEGSETGCKPMTGYGDCGGDCDDHDPSAYVQMTCGLGWCKRNAYGCTATCTPGAPAAEVCNDFDDDCDGVVDNGTDLQLCGGPGLRCVAGACVSSSSVDGGAGARAPTAVDGGARVPPGTAAGSTGALASGPAAGPSQTPSQEPSQGPSGCRVGPGGPSRSPVEPAAIALAAGLWAGARRRARRRSVEPHARTKRARAR
jgi:hypothetical protein